MDSCLRRNDELRIFIRKILCVSSCFCVFVVKKVKLNVDEAGGFVLVSYEQAYFAVDGLQKLQHGFFR
jgi:hypothetical protein